MVSYLNAVLVSALDSHWDAVVELQPGDVPQTQDHPRPVGPAQALSQLLEVGLGALAWRGSGGLTLTTTTTTTTPE